MEKGLSVGARKALCLTVVALIARSAATRQGTGKSAKIAIMTRIFLLARPIIMKEMLVIVKTNSHARQLTKRADQRCDLVL